MTKSALFVLAAVAAIAVLAMSACGGAKVQPPTTADGKPLTLVLLVDRGLEGKTPDEQIQLDQLGDFHQINLIAALKDAGYNASLIASAAEFKPAAALYLLKVAVVKYNPDAASLDVHYELYSTDPAAPFYAKDHGRASGVDWPKLVRVVDSEMIADVTNQLAAQPK